MPDKEAGHLLSIALHTELVRLSLEDREQEQGCTAGKRRFCLLLRRAIHGSGNSFAGLDAVDGTGRAVRVEQAALFSGVQVRCRLFLSY